MKDFKEINIDWKAVEKELLTLENLLTTYKELKESSQVLPFLKESPNLSALIGKLYFPDLVEINRISYEFDFFGDFKADLVIGDSAKASYVFIEFEDGTSDSIFKKKKGKYQREWANRFEHGYSQIVDWFWKLDDLKQTTSFEGKFGARISSYNGILIVGRTTSLESLTDKQRFDWRRSHTIINSKKIHCVTYDELLEDLKKVIKFFAISK
ncbi:MULTISPECIES: Shedu immune nuclease family protein [unclassified Arcicella]|uniref:Shedu immune nuclease family protein n=1 Tax=unclassified Arcicella TaxID=2644986 RepID=UPI002864ADE1|nr:MULTISPECIES: Shedu immune nuclease family protein [unclassified Arcicella]MDR6562637.1 hypothetical protein [Arcicella sp. BE51]MDR6812724.1 hypothetical protein [Arcicella sp. BE140]MDR6824036.1 hypothetical protein [Arcicella sp. BE139]